jgi:hypothetical protein
MQMSNNDNSLDPNLLGGGGPPVFKFDKIGDKAFGTLTGAQEVQQTDIKTQEPLFWPGGQPRQQLVLTIRQDDGEETRVFLKPQARAALKKAVEESGGKFELNSRVAIAFAREEPAEKAGMSPQKIFEAAYQPAPQQMDAASLL